MLRKIKGYPGYVIDPETLEIIGKRGNTLKPYKYPKSNCLRVSLYRDGKPTYVGVKDIIDRMGLGNDDWSELLKYFQEKEMKETRKDQLKKKFESFYIDEAIEEGVIVEKVGKKGYFIFNPDRFC